MAASSSPQQTAKNAPGAEGETSKAAAAIAMELLPEVRLVVLGWRWPGKSMTGNTILGREEFHLERAAEFCVTRQAEVRGRLVIVVDTPGWYCSQSTPLSYKQEIVRGASLCPPGPHAFLLVIPVGMFTEVDRARIEEHMSLFGERVWRHTIVVFTWAEVLRTISIERYIHREGKELQWVLDKCNRRYFVIINCMIGEHPQVERLLQRVEKMVAEEGSCYSPEEVEKEEKPQEETQSPPRDVRERREQSKQSSEMGLSTAMPEKPHSE